MKNILSFSILLFFLVLPGFAVSQEFYEYKRSKKESKQMLATLLMRLDSSEHIPEHYHFFGTKFLEKNESFPGYPVKAVIYVPLKNMYKGRQVVNSVWQYDSAVSLSPKAMNFFLEMMSSPTLFTGAEEINPTWAYYALVGENGIIQLVAADNGYHAENCSFYHGMPTEEFRKKEREWELNEIRYKYPKGKIGKSMECLIKAYVKYKWHYPDLNLRLDKIHETYASIITSSGEHIQQNYKLDFNTYIQVFASSNPVKIDSLASFCEEKLKQKCYVVSSFRKRHAYFRLIIRGKETEAETRKLLAIIRKTFPDAFFGTICLAE